MWPLRIASLCACLTLWHGAYSARVERHVTSGVHGGVLGDGVTSWLPSLPSSFAADGEGQDWLKEMIAGMLEKLKAGDVWKQPVEFPNPRKAFHYYMAAPDEPKNILVLRDGESAIVVEFLDDKLLSELLAQDKPKGVLFNSDVHPLKDVEDEEVRAAFEAALKRPKHQIGDKYEVSAIAARNDLAATKKATGSLDMPGEQIKVTNIDWFTTGGKEAQFTFKVDGGSKLEVQLDFEPENVLPAKFARNRDESVPFDFLKAVWGNFFEKRFNFADEQQVFTKDDTHLYVKIYDTVRLDSFYFKGENTFHGLILALPLKT